MFGWFQERKQHLVDNHFYIKQEFANTIMLLKKFARIDLLVLHLINSMFTLSIDWYKGKSEFAMYFVLSWRKICKYNAARTAM